MRKNRCRFTGAAKARVSLSHSSCVRRARMALPSKNILGSHKKVPYPSGDIFPVVEGLGPIREDLIGGPFLSPDRKRANGWRAWEADDGNCVIVPTSIC